MRPREKRRERIARDVERIRKTLKAVRRNPAIMLPAIIGKIRAQEIAKLHRRLCKDGPCQIPLAALAQALRLSEYTI